MIYTRTALRNSKQLTQFTQRFASGTKFEKFNWEDPLDLHGKLTEEEQMINEVAKNFTKDKLMPRIKDAYNKEHFDLEIMKEYGEMGFLGCTIPDYGLPGLSSTGYGLINRQIEYCDSGYRSALSV